MKKFIRTFSECSDWNYLRLHFVFFFFFSLSRVSAFLGDKNHRSRTVYHCSRTVHNYSRTVHGTPAILFRNIYIYIYIKNGSYGTIHTFKNYFATVFSVFSFNKNKLYLNGPLMSIKSQE